MRQTNSGPRKSHPELSRTEEEDDPWNNNWLRNWCTTEHEMSTVSSKSSAVTRRFLTNLGDSDGGGSGHC